MGSQNIGMGLGPMIRSFVLLSEIECYDLILTNDKASKCK